MQTMRKESNYLSFHSHNSKTRGRRRHSNTTHPSGIRPILLQGNTHQMLHKMPGIRSGLLGFGNRKEFSQLNVVKHLKTRVN